MTDGPRRRGAAHRVTVTHRTRRPARVELCGEMHHWLAPVTMTATSVDGGVRHEASVALPVGVYDYKLRVTEPGAEPAWVLDADNPRTRSRDGAQNSVLCIGGTSEPVLHAPVPPWLWTDGGPVCVRAALRRAGDRPQLTIRWDDGAGERRTPMAQVGREDEHVLLEAHLPAAGRRLRYLFELPDGRLVGAGAGQWLEASMRAVRVDAPAWWQDAVVYSIFVDRFRRGGDGWTEPDRCDRAFFAGGDLDGVREAIPHLRHLGVTVLHLTPICAAASPHRYDCIDPRRVDPALGGEDALARLIEAAHAADLRILVDVTVTHVDRGFFAFRDVAARGPASPYWPWFRIEHWPFSEGTLPGYAHYQKGQWREPLLATEHPAVADYLVGTFEHWAALGVDGFRIDAAADPPLELIARIAAAVRNASPDAALFAEVIPGNTERWTTSGVHAATDFPLQEALHDWLWRRRGSARLASALAARRFRRPGPGWTALAFTATHDQPRLRTLTDAAVARLGLVVTLLGAAVPMIYYGDEVGLASDEPGRAFEDAWPDRRCMPWDPADWDHQTLEAVRAAIAARRASPVLSRGDQQPLPAAGDVLAFRRRLGGRVVDVYASLGDVRVALDDGLPCGRTLLRLGDAVLDDGDAPQVILGPGAVIAIDRSQPVASIAELRANRALVDEAAARGMPVTPAYPANLYITITEACNLRCRHCITDAPRITREARARELAPWVINALAEPLRAADYIAFTHGGESLVSPMLDRLLEAIQRARADVGRRCDIHLLTNGMLLTGARCHQLIDRGVNSLMVSIDGATPATNDAIREGARLETILANVATAVRLRETRNADLRIGISTVLGRTNAHEMAALAHLAMDLGVDWLKLEETFPATDFARADQLAPRGRRADEAAAAVAAILAPSRVVLVDHREPDLADPAFRAADAFANRCQFVPERAAWQQACVDPDGTVRPIDFFHPSLGNLAEAPFLALWNAPLAQDLRRRAAAWDTSRTVSADRRAG